MGGRGVLSNPGEWGVSQMTSMSSPQATDCAHHWMLPAPAGGASVGVCKNCGAERTFSNADPKGWVARPGLKRK